MTSGGDCPGINATIRGVCKTAINHYGMEVIGIHSGFQGLLTKDVESFTEKSLSGLLNLGGTMLGTSREKPFKKNGVMSGVVEPVGALLTILAAGLVVPALPYLLSFAAGAMMYVVVEELIPEMSEGDHSNLGTVLFALGFTLMMALDVALG